MRCQRLLLVIAVAAILALSMPGLQSLAQSTAQPSSLQLTVYADGSVGVSYSTNETGTATPGTIPDTSIQASFATSNGETTGTINGSGSVPTSLLNQAPYNYSSSVSVFGSFAGGLSQGSAVIHAVSGISSPFTSLLLNYRGTDDVLTVTGNTTLLYGTYGSGTSQIVLNASSIGSYVTLAQREGLNSTYLNEQLGLISGGNLSVTSLSINAQYGASSATVFGNLQLHGNITVLPFILVCGYLFGMFGTFTSSAQVSASVVSCSPQAPASCEVMLQDTGSAAATVTGCSLTIGGNSVNGTVSPSNPTVPAGGSVQVSCTMPQSVSGGPSGSVVVGMLTLTNGAALPFEATWDSPGPSPQAMFSAYYSLVSSLKDYTYHLGYSDGLFGFQVSLQGSQSANLGQVAKLLQSLEQTSGSTASSGQLNILNSTSISLSGFSEKFSETQLPSGEYTLESQETGLTIYPPFVRTGNALNMSSLFKSFNTTGTFPGTVTIVGGSNSGGTVKLVIPPGLPPPSSSTAHSDSWTSIQVSQLAGMGFAVSGPVSTVTTAPSTSSRSTSASTSSGGIPEFPVQLGFALLVTVAIVASYVVTRRITLPRTGSKSGASGP